MTRLAKVLIVDDQPQNLALVRGMLHGIDAEIISAGGASDALAIAADDAFAVAIIDIQMPEIDGYELAQRLRDRKRGAPLPIIFLTAVYADEADALKGYEAGGVDFIAKPIRPVVLRSKVNVFLQLLRHRWELENKTRALEAAYVELEQTQAELFQAAKMAALGEMASMLAHEMRSPLSGIVTAVDLLRDDFTTANGRERGDVPDRWMRYVDAVSKGAAQCEQVSANLLSFSQLSGPGTDTVDLRRVVSDSVELVGPFLDRQRTALSVEICATPGAIFGDHNRLRQVLTNLLLNAAQALEQGGKIRVGCHCHGDRTEIRVSDDGPGVPAELRKTIFKSFFTTRRDRGGTGLGLSVCRQIVEDHNGTLTLENSAGNGATFVVSLPLVVDRGER